MSQNEFTKDDLLNVIRNRHSKSASTEQKKYRIIKDKLSTEGRQKVDKAKDKLTYGESEGDLWE